MKYVFLEKTNNNIAKVDLIYYSLPPKELREYVATDTIPEPETKESKEAVLCYNKKTREIFYKYVDVPKDKENELQERVNALEKSNGEMMALITTLAMPKM